MEVLLSPAAFLLGCSFVLAGTAAFGQAQPVGSYSERLDVPLVSLELFASDRAGAPVTDLEASEVVVFSDKKKVSFTNFDALPLDLPTRLVLLIDNRHVTRSVRDAALVEIGARLASEVSPTLQVMVATYDGQMKVRQSFTSERAVLEGMLEEISAEPVASEEVYSRRRSALQMVSSQLQGVRGGSAGSDRRSTYQALFLGLQTYSQEEMQEARALMQAMSTLIRALGGWDGRKSLVVLGEGLPVLPYDNLLNRFQRFSGRGSSGGGAARDTVDQAAPTRTRGGSTNPLETSRFAGRTVPQNLQMTKRFQEFELNEDIAALGRYANRSRVAMYAIPTAVTAMSEDLLPDDLRVSGRQQGGMTDFTAGPAILAELTGGLAKDSDSPLGPFLDRLLAERAARYAVAFSPPKSKEPYRELQVEIKRRGVQVRHRKGYLNQGFEHRLTDRAFGAIAFGVTSNHHQVDVQLQQTEPLEDGIVQASFVVTFLIGSMELFESDGVYAAEARAVVLLADEQGRLSEPQHVRVPVKIPAVDIEQARGSHFGGLVHVPMPTGHYQVAVGLWDAAAGRGSFISRDIDIPGS